MNYTKYLTAAGVPIELHQSAISCLEEANKKSSGLLSFKWRTRLFKNKKIAKLLSWENERLCTRYPELSDWDIAPMLNITAHGDNVPWANTPSGSRPVEGCWLDKNPKSQEYMIAVASNYWLPGTHPRSLESRAAWYRRNAGEFLAYRLGLPVTVSKDTVRIWTSDTATVYECEGVWQLVAKDRLLGIIPIAIRIGYELSNLWNGEEQAWYPIPGYELKAPLTWSIIPFKK